MLQFDFCEDQENSLDLLLKFGDEHQHPQSLTIDECATPSALQSSICVTSALAFLFTSEPIQPEEHEEEKLLVRVSEARRNQEMKLRGLWGEVGESKGLEDGEQKNGVLVRKRRKGIRKQRQSE